MEFCPICTTSFDSDDRQIHCNGQRCNLAFHQRCVHLTEVHVRSWLDDDVGLFWYCPTCRLDIAPPASSSRVDGKHKLEAEEGEPSAIKRSRIDPSPRLPPEVWTMIFRHLASRELARVRLVCRDWNELVCTRSELMERFLLKLRKRQVVEDLEEVRHLLALSKGFSRAEFEFYGLGKDKPRIVWFEPLGETLTTLTCSCIPFGFLYQMLREFPNLKRLMLHDCFEYGKVAKLNYQLTNLEELTIGQLYNKNHGESIFPTLQHICPQITVLKFLIGEYQKFFRDIRRFIFAIRHTLQDLDVSDCFNGFSLMDALAKMDGLKLKRISVYCSEQDLVHLLHRQPTLECLDFEGVVTDVSTLDKISAILPNLKQIKLNRIRLSPSASSKLLNFDRAEYIAFHYYDTSDCVSGLAYCQSSSLQRLEISGAYLPSDALTSLPQIATHIKSTSFSDCTVERSSDILSFVQQSKSLTTFAVHRLQVKTTHDMTDAAFEHSAICHLELFDSSKELLHGLLETCPRLITVDINHDLVEDDLSKMGQRLHRLESLTLNGCSPRGQDMPVECLRSIPSSFKALKKLQIKAWGAPRETVLEALNGLREDVEVSITFW
uniref:F-box domain-containing protein n=1 Tax=Culex tarsalis TaxID=7177 RepID=A0A1Q3EWM0_CULTA